MINPDNNFFHTGQCQDWQKQAIVEFFENNLSIGCVKAIISTFYDHWQFLINLFTYYSRCVQAFMQEILYENGCDQDYEYNTNTKSAETDQVQTKRGDNWASSA